MTERQRAEIFRPGRKGDDADLIVRPAIEVYVARSVAALYEEAKRFLGGVEPADRPLLPVEVVLRHAAADVDEHLDGNALGTDAAAGIGPARPGERSHEQEQSGGA